MGSRTFVTHDVRHMRSHRFERLDPTVLRMDHMLLDHDVRQDLPVRRDYSRGAVVGGRFDAEDVERSGSVLRSPLTTPGMVSLGGGI